jgi:hypothetical protein
MTRAALAGALTTLLLLTACGADEEEQAKAEISEGLMQQPEAKEMLQLGTEEADCVADGMVEGIGVDQLEKYGILGEDGSFDTESSLDAMSKKDATTLVDSVFDCTDAMAAIKDEVASSVGQQSAEVTECIDEALNEERVRSLLVGVFSGNEEQATAELTGPLMQCALKGGGPAS